MRWSLVVLFLTVCNHLNGDDCYCAICELDKLPDNCTTIYGHIQMGLESTMPPFEIVEYKLENVTKIVGCVTIANSGFTNLRLFSNLQVLQYSQSNNASTCATYGNAITIAKNSLLRRLYFESLQSVIVNKKSEYGIYISDNPSLCLTEQELEMFLKTSKFYAPHITICDPKKVYCKLDNFDFFDETNIPNECQVLTDSLVLNGTFNGNETEFQSRLDNIEQIFGSIIVLQSDIKSLKFPKLWRMYNFQPNLPIILLQNNQFLAHFETSNLSSIPYFGTWPDVLYAFRNPQLTEISAATCSQLEKLGEVTFDDNSTVCKNQSSPILAPTSSNSAFLAEPTAKTEISATGEKNKPPVNNNNDTTDNFEFRVFPLISAILTLFFVYFVVWN